MSAASRKHSLSGAFLLVFSVSILTENFNSWRNSRNARTNETREWERNWEGMKRKNTDEEARPATTLIASFGRRFAKVILFTYRVSICRDRDTRELRGWESQEARSVPRSSDCSFPPRPRSSSPRCRGCPPRPGPLASPSLTLCHPRCLVHLLKHRFRLHRRMPQHLDLVKVWSLISRVYSLTYLFSCNLIYFPEGWFSSLKLAK